MAKSKSRPKDKSKDKTKDEAAKAESDDTPIEEEAKFDESYKPEPEPESELAIVPEKPIHKAQRTPMLPETRVLPRVPLAVFLKVAGPKWDQLAGFKYYARTRKLGSMTVPEWREALQAFRTKPTK